MCFAVCVTAKKLFWHEMDLHSECVLSILMCSVWGQTQGNKGKSVYNNLCVCFQIYTVWESLQFGNCLE